MKAIQMMRYNIIEKARREICVLFPFCAGERHDADLSKQAPCRSVSCAPVDTAARIMMQAPPREPEGSIPWRGRPIGGYSMQIIKAIAFVIEAIMAIYWLLKDDRQRAIFYMILMLFLV